MNYQTLNEKELQAIIGGGQYDKSGYNLGKNVGNVIKGIFTLRGLFK